MKHLSGVCFNCGKPKKEHYSITHSCPIRGKDSGRELKSFYDSGQKALDDNAAELFEAASNVYAMESTWHHTNRERREAMDKLESILNKIKPSK